MRATVVDVFLVNLVNGASIAALTLNDVKDGVAITLGVVSTISTLLIIRGNLRKQREKRGGSDTESTEGTKRSAFQTKRPRHPREEISGV